MEADIPPEQTTLQVNPYSIENIPVQVHYALLCYRSLLFAWFVLNHFVILFVKVSLVKNVHLKGIALGLFIVVVFDYKVENQNYGNVNYVLVRKLR